jgi:hypothetical protein
MALTQKPTIEEIQKRKEGTHPREIRVCNGKTCTRNNSNHLMKRLEHIYGIKAGTTTPEVDLNYCPCQGRCKQGPNVRVNGEILMKAQIFRLKERIDASLADPGADELAMSEKFLSQQSMKSMSMNALDQPLAQSYEEMLENDFLGDLK